MSWQIALFIPATLGFCAMLWFIGTAYFRHRAMLCLSGAMAAARKGHYAEAKRLIEMAVGTDERLRQIDALHAFYATIQSNPCGAEIDTRIGSLTAALEGRNQNFADRLWSSPTFVQFLVWLFVLILMMRGCSIITR